MLARLLVLGVVVVALPRPDVSHLKTVQVKQPTTSYEVPLNSVDNNYLASRHYTYDRHNGPTHTYYPVVHYTSGSILPSLGASSLNVNSGINGPQSGYGYYHGYGSGSHGKDKGQRVHYVVQQGHGQYVRPGVHFTGQQGQGVGQGVHYVVQQGQGTGQQGIHYVQQGQGVGQQGVHYVQQGQGGGQHNIQIVTKPQQQVFTTHHGSGHGVGSGHQQQYVKNEERVYYFSAPDEVQHKTRLRINVVPTHTKKTNVIFVNTPSVPQVIPEVVVPPHQVIEDKTKVVVLVKEHDQFVPISVPAPLPTTQGKAEVFVVKYHDKNEAHNILSGGGKVYGTSLIQQDKPTFAHSLNRVVNQYSAPVVQARLGSDDISETSSFNIVDSTPKITTYAFTSTANPIGAVEVTSDKTSNVIGSFELGSNVGNLGNTGGNAPTFETYGIAQNAAGEASLSGGSSGGQQINTYEVKTFETSTNAPLISSYEIQNAQDGLGVRFGGASDLPKQSGYSYQTSEFIQNVPNAENVGLDNIEKIRDILGKSGQGIEIVSISKGSLEGSGVGPQAQQAFLKTLGLDSGALESNVGSFAQPLEIKESIEHTLQSRSSGESQIQIGDDVADVLSGSSLSS